MKSFFTKKVMVLITVFSVLLAMGTGVYADSVLKKITAYQNSELHVSVNGKNIDISSSDGPLYPLVYAGHSYVSAKALAEALGATVNWNDATQTVEVTSNVYEDRSAGKPTKDNTIIPKPSAAPSDGNNGKPQTGQTGEGAGGSPARITNILSAGFNEQEQGAKIKAHALLFLKVYAKALTTEDTTNLDKVIEGLVFEKSNDNGLKGKDYSKGLLHEKIKLVTGDQTVFADNILKLTESTLESVDVIKSDSKAIFSYKMQSPDDSPGITVTFTFTRAGGDRYLLDTITVL
jgi:hypothetical protein